MSHGPTTFSDADYVESIERFDAAVDAREPSVNLL